MEMIMSRLDDVFWSGVLVLTVLFLVLSPGGQRIAQQANGTMMAQEGNPPLRDVDPGPGTPGTTGRSAYVPAYATVQAGGGRTRIDLATTLSVHNTSREKPLLVERIAYFDTDGKLVQDYLSESITLPPLGTRQAFVAAEDRRGGAGANFVVDWRAEPGASEPVIEAVMIGSLGTTSYSFATRGHPVQTAAAR
jgi:hypothetical protein